MDESAFSNYLVNEDMSLEGHDENGVMQEPDSDESSNYGEEIKEDISYDSHRLENSNADLLKDLHKLSGESLD